jgi:hypothetical protein
MNYLNQKASPWVSFTVLAGGLLTALILFFLVKVEQDANGVLSPNPYGSDDLSAQLESL